MPTVTVHSFMKDFNPKSGATASKDSLSLNIYRCNKYFLFQIISKISMDKYIRFCSLKSRELGLETVEAFKKGSFREGNFSSKLPWSHLSNGIINVKEVGDMIVLKIIGDGNCQFQAISTVLSGYDDDSNHNYSRT